MSRGLAVIVEDSPPFAEMLRSYLDALGGFTLLVCSSAREANALLSRHRPALVLLDIQLPDGSGIEVCRQARQQLPSATILIITGSNDLVTLRACMEAGADDFVEKSHDVSRVFERLKYWAVGKRAPLDPARRQAIVEAIAVEAVGPSSDDADDPAAVRVLGAMRGLLISFYRAARARAGAQVGTTLRQKLYLLGYATGAVLGLGRVNIQVRMQFAACLKYLLMETALLPAAECDEFVATIHELYEADRFRQGSEQGQSDMLSFVQKGSEPTGLARLG